MFDEVQTGVGRTGTLWGWQASGVKPDVMTLGKGLGGGVPIGALLAREGVCCFVPGDQGGTYHGNPLMCAVALAVLEQVAAKLMARADGGHAGMLVNAVRPQRLRFVPALNMQADEVSLALVWLEAALF
jgi:acetylornithine/N-succinyldiaminopimelate aminotransferase